MKSSGSERYDAGVLSNPLSFLRSSSFRWGDAIPFDRGGDGGYWSLRSADTAYSSYLVFHNTGLNPRYSNAHGFGLAVRCKSVSKSFTTLINTSYSMKNDTQITENDIDAGALSNPLSFLRSGRFVWRDADLYYRGGSSAFWTLRSVGTTNSNYFFTSKDYLDPLYSLQRGAGMAVRCVQILHHSH